MDKLYHKLNIAFIILALTVSSLVGALSSIASNGIPSSLSPTIQSDTRDELGQKWHHLAMPIRANWIDVAYGNGKFVAVADDISEVAVSLDGIEWTMHTAITYGLTGLRTIGFGNGRFYAIGNNGYQDFALYSFDGYNWINAGLNTSEHNYSSVVHGVDIASNRDSFVSISNEYITQAFSSELDKQPITTQIVGSSGFVDITYSIKEKSWVAISDNFYLTKKDNNSPPALVSWTKNRWTSLAANPTGGFVVVSNSGSNRAMYSEDGSKWQFVDVPLNNWSRIRWTGTMYVAIASNSTSSSSVMTSKDGLTWVSQQSPSARWQAVSGYYTVGQEGIVDRLIALSDNRQDGMGLMISDITLVQVDARFDSTTTQEGAAIQLDDIQVEDNISTITSSGTSTLKGLTYTINQPSTFDKITINDEAVCIGSGITNELTYTITQNQNGNTTRLDFELSNIYNTTYVEIVVYTKHTVTVVVPSGVTTQDGKTSRSYAVNNAIRLSTSDLSNWLNQVDGNRVGDFDVVVTNSCTIDLQRSPTPQQAPEFVEQEITKAVDDIGSSFVPELQGGYGLGVLEYRSDNTTVATINSSTGEVTIVGKGKTTLYVLKQATIGWLESEESSTTLFVDISTQDAPMFDPDQYYKYLGDSDFLLDFELPQPGSPELAWASQDTEIVDVDTSGMISIKSIGTTTVSVYRKSNATYAESYKAYATIIVSERPKSPQATPDLSQSILELQYGDEYQLQVTDSESSGILIFDSSDSNIVSVERLTGKIKAQAVGQTIVSVYRQGDELYLDSDKATLIVIVDKADQSISTEKLEIDIHINSSTLDIVINGGVGVGILSYTSNNEDIATVDQNGQIVLNSTGQVEIVVYKLGDSNYNDSNHLILKLNIYDDPVVDPVNQTWLWILLIVIAILLLLLAVWLILKNKSKPTTPTSKSKPNNPTRPNTPTTRSKPAQTSKSPAKTVQATTKPTQSITRPAQPTQSTVKPASPSTQTTIQPKPTSSTIKPAQHIANPTQRTAQPQSSTNEPQHPQLEDDKK